MSALAILERSFRPLAMPVMIDDNPHHLCGVYLLAYIDSVVFIGASEEIAIRVHSHARGEMRFDRALWMPVPRAVHALYRDALIRALLPKYNGELLAGARSYDTEILYGLGLRETLTADDIDWLEVA